MNPNNPTLVPPSRTSQARSRLLPFTASRAGKLAACLILGVAALAPSARSQPTYSAAALADHPVAFWQLNEATGATTAIDSSPNLLNGTYGATASVGVSYAPYSPYTGFAVNQSALACTAGDLTSAVTLPFLDLNTNAVTIAMWINPGATEVTFTGLLMNRSSGGDAAGFGFGGTTNSAGMPALGYTWNTNNAATYNFNSALFPVPYTLQFVALVVQSNSATIYLYYVDSLFNTNLLSAVNPIAHGPEKFSAGGIFLGSDVNGTTFNAANNVFGGSISDAAVYNSALTPDQILALFAAGVGVNGFAPQITGQPISAYVVSGAPAQLTATGINGTTPITYQWQLNGTNVNALPDSANFTGATSSNVLTILNATLADAGTYQLNLVNSYGATSSSNAVLVIQPPALIGQWLVTNTLNDVSGFSPTNTHDGYDIVGISSNASFYIFTNDLPIGKKGLSLWITNLSGIAISNSSTLDGATYTNTFDNVIGNAFTVACWAKGVPSGWSPFVSKWGEGRPYNTPDGGWQLRMDGNGTDPAFTVRCEQRGTFGYGCDPGDNPDDMGTTNIPTSDGKWHFYAGTYNAGSGIRNLWVDAILAAQETNQVVYDLAPYSHLCLGAKDSAPGNTFGSYTSNLFLYDARVYNYALAQSDIQHLYGAVPAVINGQPPSAYPFLGQQASIRATVAGTQPLSFQWTLNGTPVNLLADAANFLGATSSNVLVIASVSAADQGTYVLTVMNAYGTAVSSNAILTLSVPSLVGEWFTGTQDLNDHSQYSPTNTHDGFATGSQAYAFSPDVPPYRSGYSLSFGASSGTSISISNSATGDPGYTNTFDNQVFTYITASVWLKGTFGAYSVGWPAFVVKNGESGGWQLRGDQWAAPGWTVRDQNAGTMFNGQNGGWDGNDDMSSLAGFDGNWHLYTGTYNSISGYRALYIDGALSVWETGNKPYIAATGSHLTINGEDSGGYNFTTPAFKYYDARIYNYELSAVDASNLFFVLPPGTPAQIGVQPPTNITTAYTNVTVQLNAQTAGSLPFTNQWMFNGVNLANGTLPDGAIVSGANTASLTIANVTANEDGTYTLLVTNAFGGAISTNVIVTVGALPTAPSPAGNLVGSWLTGTADLQDHSGYSPPGTHDGYGVNGANAASTNYAFSSDVPPIAAPGSVSLQLFGTAAIAISNSSTADAGYLNTYDDDLTNAMSVQFWAKGVPTGWSGWLSKHGDLTGWQLRVNNSLIPDWTMQDTGGSDISSTLGNIDQNWHNFAGVFDSVSGFRTLYVDGVVAAQAGGSGTLKLAANFPVCIGAEYANNYSTYDRYAPGAIFTGKIYGVKIYNTALTIDQVNDGFVSATARPAFLGLGAISTGPTGPQLVLTWDTGTLLQATNVTGPWTRSLATSPYTNFMTNTQMFFQVVNP